jgi:hypothetical protein
VIGQTVHRSRTNIIGEIVDKIRTDAIAWCFKHQNLTMAEAATYLVAAHRAHAPVIIAAWRESGLSLAFLAGVCAHIAQPKAGKAA